MHLLVLFFFSHDLDVNIFFFLREFTFEHDFYLRIRIHYFFVVNFQERRLENKMKILSLLYHSKQIHKRTEHQTVVLGKRFNALVEKLKIIQINSSRIGIIM